MSQPRRGRRSADSAERTRQVIVEVALRLFAERGFDAVSVRDIAEGAGTAHGLIRHHFGTKEQVWQAVLERANAQFDAAMSPVLIDAARRDDRAEALGKIVQGVVLTSARHPEIVRMLAREGTRGGPRLRAILRRIEPLREALRRVSERDADTLFLFVLIAGGLPFALNALTEEITGHDPLAPAQAQRHADHLAEILTRGG